MFITNLSVWGFWGWFIITIITIILSFIFLDFSEDCKKNNNIKCYKKYKSWFHTNFYIYIINTSIYILYIIYENNKKNKKNINDINENKDEVETLLRKFKKINI